MTQQNKRQVYTRNETDALLMKLEKRLGARLGTYHNENKATLQVILDDGKEAMEDIKEVKEQCKLTNGRVTALEKWKWAMTGGGIILSMFVVPQFLKLLGA